MADTILIVEEKEEVRRRLKSSLGSHHLEFVENTDEALKSAKRSLPDVAILNVTPPPLKGYELCAELGANEIGVVFIGSGDAGTGAIFDPTDIRAIKDRVETLLKEREVSNIFHGIFHVSTSSDLTAKEAKELAAGGFPAGESADPRPVARYAATFTGLMGASLSTSGAAVRLGVNPSRVRQRLAEGTLYGVLMDGEWKLPVFQFEKKGPVPNIRHVIRRMGRDMDVVGAHNWFTSPNVDLARDGEPLTPLEWLRRGYPWEPVASLAENLL
jgi:CheY-like chemotaxis protein